MKQFAFRKPAPCRFSFASRGGSGESKAGPDAPDGCGWLDGAFQQACVTPSQGGCKTQVGACVYSEDRIYYEDLGWGDFGQVITENRFWCEPADGFPSDTCSFDTGGCQSFESQKWYSYPTCGEPQGCGQTAAWGCDMDLVDIGGVCQKSLEYQQLCAPPAGYDSLSCSCPNGLCEEGDPPACEPPFPYTNLCRKCCTATEGGTCETPVLLDVIGNGIALTGNTDGVNFDLNGDGFRERLAWTSLGSDDAWLVLDRNANGTIDNGLEMFSNYTEQPVPPTGHQRNGFLALAEYDKLAHGGNVDGKINPQDSVFSSLRVWQDLNHNGVSEPNELLTLSQVGVAAIDLDYRSSARRDGQGNHFRYRVRVDSEAGYPIGRWAWDVFLATQ